MELFILLDIGTFIMFIIFLFFMIIVIALLTQGVSKLFNVRYRTRFGGKIADPEDWDKTMDAAKSIGGLIKDTTAVIYSKINKKSPSSFNTLKRNNSNKVEKLQKLGELKNNGIITSEEFEILKKEVIQSYF